jgi:antitoxin ParD1/3/4
MGTNVHLTPELERFAQGCVESGRFNNVSEVVRSALRLLQDAEEQRIAFVRSLEEAVDEGERDGFFTIEEVERDARSAVEDVRRRRGARGNQA